MGRASGRKAQRLNSCGADMIDELTQAMRTLAQAADKVRHAAHSVEKEYHLDITRPALDAAYGGRASADLLGNALREAVALIDTDTPISPTGVKGYRWEPPLTLEKLFLYVDVAGVDDPGYREAAQRNSAFTTDRQQKIDMARSQTCTACGRRPVYLPIDDVASECYAHLAGDELVRVERVWDNAINMLCPGCDVPAGAMCTEDEGHWLLVEGRWPRIRKFRGRSVHKERLDLSVTP